MKKENKNEMLKLQIRKKLIESCWCNNKKTSNEEMKQLK